METYQFASRAASSSLVMPPPCPCRQVTVASWEAGRAALVMVVLRQALSLLSAAFGVVPRVEADESGERRFELRPGMPGERGRRG